MVNVPTNKEMQAAWACIDTLRAAIGQLLTDEMRETETGKKVEEYLAEVINRMEPWY